MAFYGDADIQVMLDDLGGVLVVVGAASAKCHVDYFDEEVMHGVGESLVGALAVVRSKTGTFAFTPGGALTIGGVAYKVVRSLQEQDGATVLTTCAKIV